MTDRNRIDYSKISAAISHYNRVGYDYMEVPWLVSVHAINVTKPPWASSLEAATSGNWGFSWGHLVGSGEQSFIELAIKKDPKLEEQLLIGAKRCCATPCFRDERTVDDLHRRYFFKVELIEVVHPKSDCDLALNRMISLAEDFFCLYVPIKRVKTDEGYDIQLASSKNPVELGSYGVREIRGFKWIYGTGCAEPRLSQAEWILADLEEEARNEQRERARQRLDGPKRVRPKVRSKKASRRNSKA